ncbi:MAG: ABC transporter permease [Lachnospiraceae bacterium]|nr:ABC transporter permease [Lachnospiraceae bacterium]
MLKYILKRLIILIPVVILITIILFWIRQLMPGDPIRMMLSPNLRPEVYQNAYDTMARRLGYDRPVYEQYFRWIYNLVAHRDLGHSTMYNRPVAEAVAQPLRNSILLNGLVNMFYLLIALPLGIKMAVKRHSFFDNSMQVFSLVTYSIPSFFIGLTLLFIFGITVGWLPLGGMPNRALIGEGLPLVIAWVRHLILPVTTLTIVSLATAMRYVRNAMIDALSQDYIRTARSKGLSEKVVIYSHAFRNALIPISTVIVFTIFALFAGAALTESVFQYNGIGYLLVQAVRNRDTMMIISMNLFFAIVNVTAVLIADIIYGLVDPRIKLK